ncbi:MAG: hypothetical protein ACRD38_13200, partial [Nitrososphaerales archaeon]
MYWSSQDVWFYYERHEIDGDVVSLPLIQYDPVTMGPNDPSRTFKMGTKAKAITIPCNTTPTFKFYQFGPESTGLVTQSWTMKQYDLYAAGTSLATSTA